MSVCTRLQINPDKQKYIEKYINTKVDKVGSVPFGFSSSISQGGKRIYTYGYRNIEEKLPFESNSIYRMASQGKFVGTVGFLKLIDQGKVEWETPLSLYFPEYSKNRMGVINPIDTPPLLKTLINPICTTLGSNLVRIYFNDHDFQVGDYVSLEWSNGSLGKAEVSLPDINGIPGFELFNIHQIVQSDKRSFTVRAYTKAKRDGITGGFVKIRLVEPGTKRSIYFQTDKTLVNPKLSTYYYTLIPLKRELTVLDVMTHGLGWSYYSSTLLYMSFGYSSDLVRQNIQAGIWNESGILVGIPLECFNCDIQKWVEMASNIPLLYQPGEDWSYGPQTSILGGLIERITGTQVEEYFRNELFEPLGMKDTGFFIHSDDQIDRLSTLYINVPKIVEKFIGKDIPFPPIHEAQTCLYEGPKKLCFIDSGMYTTVNDYLKFMKLLLNEGRSEKGVRLLSKRMIEVLSTYRTEFDVSNLSSMEGYSEGLCIPASEKSEIKRKALLSNIRWGLGVGTIEGCKPTNPSETVLALTWAGVLGTRFLIDFCEGVAYNAGTNVVGPPAGTFDSDLIELNYKRLTDGECHDLIIDYLI